VFISKINTVHRMKLVEMAPRRNICRKRFRQTWARASPRRSFLALLEDNVLTDDGIKLAKKELVRQLGRIFPREVCIARVGSGQQLDKDGLELFCSRISEGGGRFQWERVGGEIRKRNVKNEMRGKSCCRYANGYTKASIECMVRGQDAPSCLP
jgi:hypothetical protein